MAEEKHRVGDVTYRPIAGVMLLNRKKIFFEEGLYVEHDFAKLDESALRFFKTGEGPVDGYCPFCKRESVFYVGGPDVAREREERKKAAANISMPGRSGGGGSAPDHPMFMLRLICARVPASHNLDFHFVVTDTVLQKVGQYPSHATIAMSEVDRFRKILAEDRLKELKRGIGLNAHGIGIGAFVYVRRVFESLVEDAHQQAVADGGWDETAYQAAKTNNRIALLRAHLPEVLVNNAAYYGVVSKGIHELQEQECLEIFPVIQKGIEAILDEILEKRERDRRSKDFTSALGKATSALGKKEEPGPDAKPPASS